MNTLYVIMLVSLRERVDYRDAVASDSVTGQQPNFATFRLRDLDFKPQS